MSGGSYDYAYATVKRIYCGEMHDSELNEMMEDLIPLLHDLEWWQSGDIGQDEYRKLVAAFKAKWFGRTQEERVTALIETSVKEAEKNLRIAFLGELEEESYTW